MNILLDTNAYSELFRGNETILKWLEDADFVFMSIVVIAELLSGFKGGSKDKSNTELLQKFLSNPKVKILNATFKTATIFAELKNYLKTLGRLIPINDVWIAAHSFEFDATLLTFDNHFKALPKLKIWNFVN